jgi:hypothetical protein
MRSDIRTIGRPFQPGRSGNPGGRPRSEDDVRNLARQHSRRALERIIALIDSDDPRVALAAAREVLDRAYGKPRLQDGTDSGHELTVRIVRFGEIMQHVSEKSGSSESTHGSPTAPAGT